MYCILEETMDVLEKLAFKYTKQGMKKRILKENETSFLGEENGSRRREKRHRYIYEK